MDSMHLLPPATNKYADNALRVQHRAELIPILKEIFMTKTRDEWQEAFKGYHFPSGPVRSIQEAFEDEQVLHRDMVQEVQHPTVGPLKLVGPPVKYSRTPAAIHLPPPLLGEHTRSVLQTLNAGPVADQDTDVVTEAQIDEWMANGYIQ
jgi:crotonobetainyl-CoA:carnitine CoA-transferase CaiB-like acyl-CoA transferase